VGGEVFPKRPARRQIAAGVRAAIAAAKDADCRALKGEPCRYPRQTPVFNSALRALCVGGQRLHGFSEQAGNEVLILEEFEAAGWPDSVADPLGASQNEHYGSWIKAAVFCLNHCQRPWLIRFRSHPRTRSVTWEWNGPEH